MSLTSNSAVGEYDLLFLNCYAWFRRVLFVLAKCLETRMKVYTCIFEHILHFVIFTSLSWYFCVITGNFFNLVVTC